MARDVFELARVEREKRLGEVGLGADRRRAAVAFGFARAIENAGLSRAEWITVREVAGILGLGEEGVRCLVRLGHLRGNKVGRTWVVSVQSVEFERKRRAGEYKKLTAEDGEGGGGKSLHSDLCYLHDGECGEEGGPHPLTPSPNSGRRGTVENEDEAGGWYRALTPPQPSPSQGKGFSIVGRTWVDRDNDDVWMPAVRAAALLDLSVGRLSLLVRQGRLHRRWADKRTNLPVEGFRSREAATPEMIGRVHAMYSRNELLRFDARRQSKGRFRSFPANDPERPLRCPSFRPWSEFPGREYVMTIAEAANILGVRKQRVSELLKAGRLSGWSKTPGKPGNRVWLSSAQVWRYSKHEDRLRRRDAHFKGREGTKGTQATRGWKIDAFREDNHFWEAPSKALKKDHGEFYSTLQASEILGVSRGAIRNMRVAGVLKGYRSPNSRETFNRKRWWFYKKEDVDALKVNSDHIRRRKVYWRVRQPWAYEDSTER